MSATWPGRVPLEQLLLIRRRHQARERAQPVLVGVGNLDRRTVRRRRRGRHRGAAVGNEHGRDLLAVGGELEASRRASRAAASWSAAATCPSRHRRSRCASHRRCGRRYATLALSGDHTAFETRAPAGIWIGFLRAVGGGDRSGCRRCCGRSARARGWPCSRRRRRRARGTAWRRSSSTTGPSPISSRNHFLSGLRLASVTLRCRGASTASTSSLGGCE